MADDPRQLQETVERLHRQLAEVDRVDPQTHVLLERALDDILETLAKHPEAAVAPPPAATEEGSLADRLNAAARHFQQTHPTLSNTLTGIVEALQRMGI